MTSACRASNLHRAILLPSDNLVNVVSCTQGHWVSPRAVSERCRSPLRQRRCRRQASGL